MFQSVSASGARWRAGLRHRLVAVGLMLLCFTHSAWSEDLPEYRLKAAFLYNFAVFTQWPPEVGNVLKLCVYGRDPFGTEIDEIDGKAVAARKLAVRRAASIQAVKDCHIVFVPNGEISQLPKLRDAVRGSPALMVTETPGALKQGATINMSIVQGRVTFEANLQTARDAGLTLSSKMLRLATVVIQ